MRRCSIGLMALALAASAVNGGCGKVDHVPGDLGGGAKTSTGEIQLALVAEGSSGNLYRLRYGEFQIWGYATDTYLTVSTEDYLDNDTIDLSLPPDEYEVFLYPGFRMERIGMEQDTEPEQDAGSSSEDTEMAFETIGDAARGTKNTGMSERPYETVWDSDVATWDSDQATDVGSPSGEYVEAELISENPVYVEVYPETTSFVNFTFMVGGEIVGPEDGILSIGISVEEIDTSDCVDAFEPNNDFPDASPVTLESPIEAAICGNDSDFFIFEAPLSEGEGFVLTVHFSNAISDLDVALYNASGVFIDDSTSISDQEQVGTLADGGTYVLEVYPYSFGGTNRFTVKMSTVGQSSCCEASVVPGCADPDVEACVCDQAYWCCEEGFDEYCVEIAFTECSAQCELGDGDCCEASEGPGCNDVEVQSCICQLDYACCTEAYDEFCVEEAMAECGLECNSQDPDSDCCTTGENPGCTNDDVEACVCGIDPFCCAAPFDSNCVGLAVDVCGADC